MQARPDLAGIFPHEEFFGINAWHFIPYNYHLDIHEVAKGEIPMILLEPSSCIDFEAFLRPYLNGPTIFVCETFPHLNSALENDVVREALANPQNLLYRLDVDPEEQILVQKYQPFKAKSFGAIVPRDISHMKSFFPRLAKALSSAISSLPENPENLIDTSDAMKNLYNLAAAWVKHQRAERLGKSRALSLFEKHRFMDHPKHDADLGFTPKDYVRETLNDALRLRKPRPFSSDRKLRLVHIVPEIVDGGDTFLRQKRNLFYNADFERFEVFVISTENVQPLTLAYPTKLVIAHPSTLRGDETFHLLKENGIEVFLAEPVLNVEKIAQTVVGKLEGWNADIAIFHGTDAVNLLIAASTNTPLRILLESNVVPEYPVFDHVITNNELPLAVDVRKSWKDKPQTLDDLGIPADAFVMTTFVTRFSRQFYSAVAEILKRCPNAWYIPLGNLSDIERIRTLFASFGVDDRIRFLEHQRNPAQIVRSTHLYLQEFPNKSLLGLLEAMAAGCPIVPMQSTTEDYIALACKLITDKKMYAECSAEAKEKFLQFADEKSYVKEFEKIILAHIEKRG